jgi:SAM-dependent methyltransferase
MGFLDKIGDPAQLSGKFGSKNWLINRLFLQELQQAMHHIQGIVVDLGCGDKPFEALLAPHSSIGVDKSALTADIVADISTLPLTTGSIDTVICFRVMDDIAETTMFLDEVYRVLRPGGVLLLSVNQTWRTHDPPDDYYRWTKFGLKYVLEKSHFTVGEIKPIGGLWAFVSTRTVFWLYETIGCYRLLSPFTTILGTMGLIVGLILDKLNFIPEDTATNFTVAKK